MADMDFKKLAEPFDETDIEWFVGVTTRDKSKGLAIPYITNRAVQERLDTVCGPENWRNEYRPLKDSDVIDKNGTIIGRKSSQLCGIGIWSEKHQEFITKWDGAEDTDVEALKGGLSSAMKRAATQWGIGRYLYRLENVWVEIEAKGNSYVIKPTQKIVLPQWALPGGSGIPGPNEDRRPRIQIIGQGQTYANPPQQPQEAPSQPQPQPRSGNLSAKQIDRAYKKGYAAGQTPEQIQFWVEKKYGITNMADLNRAQYEELCAALDKAAMAQR